MDPEDIQQHRETTMTEAKSGPAEAGTQTKAAGDHADPELDLSLDLNGQEPTSKNLILAAIGVMKNRKARPDSKRISNWINRRYGRPMAEVEEELERLVSVGELARVDYKGSASFRIVQPDAKAKRRRRGTKPLGRTPSRTPVALGGVFPPLGPPPGQHMDNSLTQTQMLTPTPATPPLTLRTLVYFSLNLTSEYRTCTYLLLCF